MKGGIKMTYVPIPKDLTKVKTKVLFNLTKRQLICFGAGALIGVPAFFLLEDFLGSSAASMCMIVLMLPFFLMALYEKNGRPLEKVVWDMIQVSFIRPKVRPYKTQNYYALLQRQRQLNQEVSRIVLQVPANKTERQKAKTGRKKAEPGRKKGDCPGS